MVRFIISIFHPDLGLENGLFLSGSFTKTFYASVFPHMRAVCPAILSSSGVTNTRTWLHL